jgi:hypothetical protein
MVPTRAQREAGAPLTGYGTTVRLYDPQIDAWRVVWASVSYQQIILFTARRDGDEILMEAEYAQPAIRWIFSDITYPSFHWRNVESNDGWKTMELRQEMTVTRSRR